MYYIMAHFSKFLPGGGKSWRIDTQVSGKDMDDNKVQFVGFWNEERNQSVVIVQNRGDRDQSVSITVNPTGSFFRLQVEGNSVKTVIF